MAPLSNDPELHAAILERLDRVVGLGREVLGDSLRSVILGGSLARGRAFGVRDAGRLRLLSDLDLYFVTEDTGKASALRLRISDWIAGDRFFVTPADVAVVTPEFFAEAPDSMPVHQLAHAHRVLAGEPVGIEGARSDDGRDRVDPDDAAALLFNRCIEALDPRLTDPRSLPALLLRTKTFIDAPMAWLGARGDYSPDRREQLESFAATTSDWEGCAATRRDGGLEHWSACLDARDRGVVERAALESLALADGRALPGGARFEDWSGAFALSLLGGRNLDVLRSTLESGLSSGDLSRAVRRWLRREPTVGRLRRARRWGSVAPSAVTPWWRHGWGGAGPDRIFAAAVLRAHSVEGWDRPLVGLLREALESPAALHALWWRWIQGRDDEA